MSKQFFRVLFLVVCVAALVASPLSPAEAAEANEQGLSLRVSPVKRKVIQPEAVGTAGTGSSSESSDEVKVNLTINDFSSESSFYTPLSSETRYPGTVKLKEDEKMTIDFTISNGSLNHDSYFENVEDYLEVAYHTGQETNYGAFLSNFDDCIETTLWDDLTCSWDMGEITEPGWVKIQLGLREYKDGTPKSVKLIKFDVEVVIEGKVIPENPTFEHYVTGDVAPSDYIYAVTTWASGVAPLLTLVGGLITELFELIGRLINGPDLSNIPPGTKGPNQLPPELANVEWCLPNNDLLKELQATRNVWVEQAPGDGFWTEPFLPAYPDTVKLDAYLAWGSMLKVYADTTWLHMGSPSGGDGWTWQALTLNPDNLTFSHDLNSYFTQVLEPMCNQAIQEVLDEVNSINEINDGLSSKVSLTAINVGNRNVLGTSFDGDRIQAGDHSVEYVFKNDNDFDVQVDWPETDLPGGGSEGCQVQGGSGIRNRPGVSDPPDYTCTRFALFDPELHAHAEPIWPNKIFSVGFPRAATEIASSGFNYTVTPINVNASDLTDHAEWIVEKQGIETNNQGSAVSGSGPYAFQFTEDFFVVGVTSSTSDAASNPHTAKPAIPVAPGDQVIFSFTNRLTGADAEALPLRAVAINGSGLVSVDGVSCETVTDRVPSNTFMALDTSVFPPVYRPSKWEVSLFEDSRLICSVQIGNLLKSTHLGLSMTVEYPGGHERTIHSSAYLEKAIIEDDPDPAEESQVFTNMWDGRYIDVGENQERGFFSDPVVDGEATGTGSFFIRGYGDDPNFSVEGLVDVGEIVVSEDSSGSPTWRVEVIPQGEYGDVIPVTITGSIEVTTDGPPTTITETVTVNVKQPEEYDIIYSSNVINVDKTSGVSLSHVKKADGPPKPANESDEYGTDVFSSYSQPAYGDATVRDLVFVAGNRIRDIRPGAVLLSSQSVKNPQGVLAFVDTMSFKESDIPGSVDVAKTRPAGLTEALLQAKVQDLDESGVVATEDDVAAADETMGWGAAIEEIAKEKIDEKFQGEMDNFISETMDGLRQEGSMWDFKKDFSPEVFKRKKSNGWFTATLNDEIKASIKGEVLYSAGKDDDFVVDIGPWKKPKLKEFKLFIEVAANVDASASMKTVGHIEPGKNFPKAWEITKYRAIGYVPVTASFDGKLYFSVDGKAFTEATGRATVAARTGFHFGTEVANELTPANSSTVKFVANANHKSGAEAKLVAGADFDFKFAIADAVGPRLTLRPVQVIEANANLEYGIDFEPEPVDILVREEWEKLADVIAAHPGVIVTPPTATFNKKFEWRVNFCLLDGDIPVIGYDIGAVVCGDKVLATKDLFDKDVMYDLLFVSKRFLLDTPIATQMSPDTSVKAAVQCMLYADILLHDSHLDDPLNDLVEQRKATAAIADFGVMDSSHVCSQIPVFFPGVDLGKAGLIRDFAIRNYPKWSLQARVWKSGSVYGENETDRYWYRRYVWPTHQLLTPSSEHPTRDDRVYPELGAESSYWSQGCYQSQKPPDIEPRNGFPDGLEWSCDEFPDYSMLGGGKRLDLDTEGPQPVAAYIDAKQNSEAGGMGNVFYTECNIKPLNGAYRMHTADDFSRDNRGPKGDEANVNEDNMFMIIPVYGSGDVTTWHCGDN